MCAVVWPHFGKQYHNVDLVQYFFAIRKLPSISIYWQVSKGFSCNILTTRIKVKLNKVNGIYMQRNNIILSFIGWLDFKAFSFKERVLNTKAASEPEKAPRFGRTDSDSVNRLIIAHEINCIIFWNITPYKIIKMHTTCWYFMEFWNKEAFIMQNTGNFNHFYNVRFEASLKYVILKCRLIKSLLHI